MDSRDAVNSTGMRVVCPKIAKPFAVPNVTFKFRGVLALEKWRGKLKFLASQRRITDTRRAYHIKTQQFTEHGIGSKTGNKSNSFRKGMLLLATRKATAWPPPKNCSICSMVLRSFMFMLGFILLS